MKTTPFIMFLLILFGALIGGITSYLTTRNVWNYSEASSILNKSGVVVSDVESLTYFANTESLNRDQLEALAMLGESYKKTFVILKDEVLSLEDPGISPAKELQE